MGHASIRNQGLFKSEDHGDTWVTLNRDIEPGLDQLDISSFSISTDVIYVGSSTTATAYISTDLGQTWITVPDGLSPTGHIISTPSGHLIAEGGGGLVRSEDFGQSWIRINTGIGLSQVIATSIDDKGDVYVATRNKGVYWSTDNGDSWNSTAFPSTFINSMAVGQAGEIFVSTQDSIFATTDRGESWTPLTAGLREQKILHMTFDSQGFLFAGGVNTGILQTSSPVLASSVSRAELQSTSGLRQLSNYPNPFSKSTRIQYELTRPSRVELSVFTLTGQKVLQLEKTYKLPGKYEVIFDAQNLRAGIYFYRLTTDTHQSVESMILVR